MAKVLDFNTVERPTLELIMQDEARTHIEVGTPTEGLVEELSAMSPRLDKVLQSKDAESIRAIYDLAARLINCNRNFVKVTAEELRGKYRMNLESLVIFYGAYIEFLDEIMKEKN
jgi:hypothetical protein